MKTWRDVLPPDSVERLLAASRSPKAPYLAIASAAWADGERQKAFAACYKRMREMDDLVDGAKAKSANLSAAARERLVKKVQEACKAKPGAGAWAAPAWTMKAWARAMISDVGTNGFKTLRDLRVYSEGAAVAPGAIFLQLCGHPSARDERALRDGARPLSIFCYLVHLARDMEVDGRNGICNMPDDLLHVVGLDRAKLLHSLKAPHPSEPLRRLMGRLRAWSLRRQRETRAMLDQCQPLLTPDAAFSLEAVFTLYTLILVLMNPGGPDFKTASLTPETAALEASLTALLDGPCPAAFG
ncbi:MAG: squalene/phytoene synthase family protein [Spirochaetes bacterium]|nr:squalene/phytoene synthase family protein [Spirochaetota bacterium]